ncbi:hypothetical protein [uncultured Cellulomonas sp.]|uniref:hypothetical protein n=1 Tax=uncultured Cellulomonas sp. TaxID=189682 RepID=UPI0028E2EE26|nr:hypothetical protein [uncultured Cellulomonas sp.]
MDTISPDWNLIDLRSAPARARADGDQDLHLAARHESKGCKVALVADEPTGWLVVVITNTGTGESFIPSVVAPEGDERMRGSVAPAHGQGPRIHYAIARGAPILGVRVRGAAEQWTSVAVEPNGWAVISWSSDDFFEVPLIEVLEADAWVELV